MNTEFGDPMLEVRTEGSLVFPSQTVTAYLKGMIFVLMMETIGRFGSSFCLKHSLLIPLVSITVYEEF